jgi:transposase
VNAYLFYTAPPGQRRLYSPSQITRAEAKMGLSRKAGSTTAMQAKLPRNIMKRWQFWNTNYPYGIADIARENLIDVDEAGIFLETCNRGMGKSTIGKRVRQEGPYGHSEKWTLKFAIAGEGNQCWTEMQQVAGTTIVDFALYIQMILDDLPQGNAQRRRCFIMDNLSSHVNGVITQIIHAAGHRIVFRAPYYPVDGPIEYSFNTVQQELNKRMYEIETHAQLQEGVLEIIGQMRQKGFGRYFEHCGY